MREGRLTGERPMCSFLISIILLLNMAGWRQKGTEWNLSKVKAIDKALLYLRYPPRAILLNQRCRLFIYVWSRPMDSVLFKERIWFQRFSSYNELRWNLWQTLGGTNVPLIKTTQAHWKYMPLPTWKILPLCTNHCSFQLKWTLEAVKLRRLYCTILCYDFETILTCCDIWKITPLNVSITNTASYVWFSNRNKFAR